MSCASRPANKGLTVYILLYVGPAGKRKCLTMTVERGNLPLTGARIRFPSTLHPTSGRVQAGWTKGHVRPNDKVAPSPPTVTNSRFVGGLRFMNDHAQNKYTRRRGLQSLFSSRLLLPSSLISALCRSFIKISLMKGTQAGVSVPQTGSYYPT